MTRASPYRRQRVREKERYRDCFKVMWSLLSHTCCYSCTLRWVQAEQPFEVLPGHATPYSDKLLQKSLVSYPHLNIHIYLHSLMNSWAVMIPRTVILLCSYNWCDIKQIWQYPVLFSLFKSSIKTKKTNILSICRNACYARFHQCRNAFFVTVTADLICKIHVLIWHTLDRNQVSSRSNFPSWVVLPSKGSRISYYPLTEALRVRINSFGSLQIKVKYLQGLMPWTWNMIQATGMSLSKL